MCIRNYLRGLLTTAFLVTAFFITQVQAAPKPWFVDESLLPFEPLAGASTQWGVHAGAAYLIEVPDDWNGDLVLYAHGFRGNVPELTVGPPRIRAHLIANGYAWASSSYSANGYIPATGAQDTHRLAKQFGSLVGQPSRVYLTGDSMGGHVIGFALEQWPNDFAGATPRCGVMGDSELFDYFQDVYLAGETLIGNTPAVPTPLDYQPDGADALRAALGPAFPFVLNDAGEKFKAVIKNLTGGERPVYDAGFVNAQGGDFVIGQAGTGGGRDNIGTIYRFEDGGLLTGEEEAFNELIARVAGDPQYRHKDGMGNFPGAGGGLNSPQINGTFQVPVVSLHTLGELFVPFHMEQIYARRAEANGNGHLLVQRAIRDVFHCSFTPEEMSEAFDDLVGWVETGARPGGDDVLNPAAVADPSFGCDYTRDNASTNGYRPFVGVPACPAP
jgi:hypothetical protein